MLVPVKNLDAQNTFLVVDIHNYHAFSWFQINCIGRPGRACEDSRAEVIAALARDFTLSDGSWEARSSRSARRSNCRSSAAKDGSALERSGLVRGLAAVTPPPPSPRS